MTITSTISISSMISLITASNQAHARMHQSIYTIKQFFMYTSLSINTRGPEFLSWMNTWMDRSFLHSAGFSHPPSFLTFHQYSSFNI
mmetsp:Transcript_21452/g.45162  ORF Transcript_21452/g.45162 Transcript_21452/m.45162 type:complete len:87 (-) Transcript_21452:28-288(-)